MYSIIVLSNIMTIVNNVHYVFKVCRLMIGPITRKTHDISRRSSALIFFLYGSYFKFELRWALNVFSA